jgi:hypothetical protein
MSVCSYSQGYHKLIRTNTYWDVWYTVSPEWCYSQISRIFFTGADTIVNGHVYKLSRDYPFHQLDTIPYLCPPFEILKTSYSTDYYLREDTLAKKVYISCNECSPFPPIDELFYDFSLNVGDTLHSEWASQGAILVCTSIDSVILLNGETRKRFIFNNDGWYNYIESLGGDNGLFLPLIPCIDCMGGYFCQTENDINLWGNDCSNYFVGIDNYSEEQYSLGPNPAHDFVNVTVNQLHSIYEISLSNIQGQEVLKKTLSDKSNKISLSNFIPGIYIYRINTNKGIKQGKLCIF